MTHPPEREIGSELTGALHHSTGSYELVIAALAAAGLGFWIDSVLGIRPVLTLVFAFAGFIGAGYSIYLKYQVDMAEANATRTARTNVPFASVQATASSAPSQASKAIARDERVSGAERNAPTDPSLLRANAAVAAKQDGKSSRDERVSEAERSAQTEDSVLRANAGFAAKQESKSSTA